MTRRFRLSAYILSLVFALSGGLSAQTSSPDFTQDTPTRQEPLKPREDIKGLSNFVKVSDVLYRGAQPTKEGFTELKRLGVKTVINLRARHSDEEFLKGLDLKYFSIPINTWNLDNEHAARFLSIVLDKANQPVFVHCQHGSDRTSTMVAVYRVYAQKWKADDAMKELPVFGFHKLWVNLKRYLRNLDIKKIETEIERLREGAAVKKS